MGDILSIKNLRAIVAIVLAFSIAVPSQAQVTMTGGKGLLRLFDSETVYPGLFYINPTYLAYAKKSESKDGEEVSFAEDHNLNLGLTLGLSQSFEIVAQLVPYQDDQKHIWGPNGDTRIGIKYHMPGKKGLLQFGLLGFATFPTAPEHNVRFEPFSVDKNSWGLVGITTLDFKAASANMPLKILINVGYRDLDWQDRFFHDKKDQLIGGFGLKFPIRSSVLYSEFSGEVFINNSDQVAFSQNSLRFTQGIRFLGPWHLIVDIAGDFELGDRAPSDALLASNPFLKDYADWKFVVGASYQMTLFRYLTAEEKLARRQRQEEQNKLDSIRQKREKAAKELEEMKKNLDKDRQKEP